MKTTPVIEGLMTAFAERTGLDDSEGVSKRYLWTDAFAVCNYLELYRCRGDKRFLEIALALVDQVHAVLGQHRDDDPREGWISGLSEEDGKCHPTRGGLRIGKERPERRCEEPFDEAMEWERDGQYYHYLTKWMHALCRVAQVTGDARYILWALELAQSAHASFTYFPEHGARKRMAWKLSIDLSYPLVPSMGHHDPLDGLITYQQIETRAKSMGVRTETLHLQTEIAEMTAMSEGASWQTADTLGIGGLLMDACCLAQLMAQTSAPNPALLAFLLEEVDGSLEALTQSRQLNQPVARRIAFRELGLAIGLHAIEQIQKTLSKHPERFPSPQALTDRLSRLTRYEPLAGEIEALWLKPGHQESRIWKAHEDINRVMLATSLGSAGVLTL